MENNRDNQEGIGGFKTFLGMYNIRSWHFFFARDSFEFWKK